MKAKLVEKLLTQICRGAELVEKFASLHLLLEYMCLMKSMLLYPTWASYKAKLDIYQPISRMRMPS
jgi:hypothetical protein